MSPIYLGDQIISKITKGDGEIPAFAVGNTLINFYSNNQS